MQIEEVGLRQPQVRNLRQQRVPAAAEDSCQEALTLTARLSLSFRIPLTHVTAD